MPNGNPPPLPPAGPPQRVLWACLLDAGVTVGGTCLFWFAVRVPWATMLVGWVLACLAVAACAWVYSRALRRLSTADPSAATEPDPRAAGAPGTQGVR